MATPKLPRTRPVLDSLEDTDTAEDIINNLQTHLKDITRIVRDTGLQSIEQFDFPELTEGLDAALDRPKRSDAVHVANKQGPSKTTLLRALSVLTWTPLTPQLERRWHRLRER